MKYFYETQLSEHIGKDNIGQLICKDVIIARSGDQVYLDGEVDGTGSTKKRTLHRPWKVVKASYASFEGKPFVKLHPDIGTDITIQNIDKFSVGHIQNVRADDDKEVLIADVIVNDPETIKAIESKQMRDVSCGYFYKLDDMDVVTEIIGEHLALVPEGRAGIARIQDAAINDFTSFMTTKKVEDIKVKDWLYIATDELQTPHWVDVTKLVTGEDKMLIFVHNGTVLEATILAYDDIVKCLDEDKKRKTEADISKLEKETIEKNPTKATDAKPAVTTTANKTTTTLHLKPIVKPINTKQQDAKLTGGRISLADLVKQLDSGFAINQSNVAAADTAEKIHDNRITLQQMIENMSNESNEHEDKVTDAKKQDAKKVEPASDPSIGKRIRIDELLGDFTPEEKAANELAYQKELALKEERAKRRQIAKEYGITIDDLKGDDAKQTDGKISLQQMLAEIEKTDEQKVNDRKINLKDIVKDKASDEHAIEDVGQINDNKVYMPGLYWHDTPMFDTLPEYIKRNAKIDSANDDRYNRLPYELIQYGDAENDKEEREMFIEKYKQSHILVDVDTNDNSVIILAFKPEVLSA